MTKEEQQSEFINMVAKMRETLLSKGDDYANEDRLSNFKIVANMVGITPQQVAMVFIGTKITRIANLQGKTASNESIQDSVLDLANYAVLLGMIESEGVVKYKIGVDE